MRRRRPTSIEVVLLASLLAAAAAAGGPRAAAAPTAPPASDGTAVAAEAARSDTLTLAEAVRIGLGEDPDLREARADRAAASSRRLADYGAFLPRLTADASFTRRDFTTVTFAAPDGASERREVPLDGVRKSSSQSLGLSWTLLEGGRRIASWKAGGASLEASRHRISAAERRTVAEVRVAYFNALEQRALVETARRQLEARRRDLGLARKRYAIADADRSELLGARSDTLDARMRLVEARWRARTRIRELRTAMGVESERVPTDVPLSAVEQLPRLDSVAEARLVRRAIGSHPELAALGAEARAASAERWAARANYLPSLSLGYDVFRSEQLGPEGDFFVLDPSNDQQSVSLRLSWNLFDGLQREQQERQASAALQRARAQRSQRALEIEAAVRDRVEELRRRRERLAMLREKVDLARERLEVTREQFRLGDVSYVELQQVIEGLDAAERDRIGERYAYLRAWAELVRRTGTVGGEEDPGGSP